MKSPPPMSQPELIKRCLDLDDDAKKSYKAGRRRSSGGMASIRNYLAKVFNMSDGRFVRVYALLLVELNTTKK